MVPEVIGSLSTRWGRVFFPWMWSGKKLATLLFLLSSLVVLSYGGALLEVFSYLQNLREIRSYSRVVHGIDRITADVRRIQSGRSGYLLSGRSAYLVAYTSGIESLFRDTEDLKSLLMRTGSVFGRAELDMLTSQNGEVLLPMARTLEHRGLMETRAHFLKVDHAIRLPDTNRTLQDLRFRYRQIALIREQNARKHLLRTSGFFGLSFVLFSAFLGLTATRITKDISSVNRLVSHLYHDARHDLLTELPNRACVMDALDRCLEDPSVRERGLALLYIDLDGFKGVNDRWGHDKGDMALQCVAKRFLGVLREGDILARLGGDEFLLFLQGCRDPAIPMRVAFRLVRALSEPLEIAPERVYLGASIGIALCPDDGVSSETLLKKADEAMYRSKSAGGNCFHFAGQKEGSAGDVTFRPGLPVRMKGRTALSEDPPSGEEAGNLPEPEDPRSTG